ncbi:MAG TPA: PEP/pyruvate-binding domain-containing protein, partial [Nitrospiraceae bacterium]|nr:PEP/pyruvate-binding domain-containing protein [Nitrospiraceae bacterium]
MSDRFVLPLESCSNPALVGGKAARLGYLLKSGFHVPRGVCLTTLAYVEALQAAGAELSRQWVQVRQASDHARGPMLEKFGRVARSLTVPQAILDRLGHEIDKLGMDRGTLWAVRSSASDEDQANASFSGLYRSILGVPRGLIGTAIVECWGSLWTLAAHTYRSRRGWRRTDPAMAVLLQPLLSPRAAGVAYSCHPVTAQHGLVVINAVFGLAEPLMGGMISPDQYVIKIGNDEASGTVLERDIAQKATARVVTPAGLRDQSLSEEDRTRPVLEEQDILALADLVKHVERTMGKPVDVEWAIDSNGIWLLQARPIPDTKFSQGLTNQSCEWSRANFKETLPEVPSPLGLSFLQEFMETNILRHYRELGCSIPRGLSAVRIFRGRPYINVTLFQSFMRQLGGNPALVIEQMGGEGRLFQGGPSRLAWWRLIRAGVLMEWKIRQAARRAPAWFAAMKEMA